MNWIHVSVAEAGQALEAAHRAGLSLPSVCHGAGMCGTCAVRVRCPPPPSPREKALLGALVEQGVRLCCTLPPGLHQVAPPPVQSLLRSHEPSEVWAPWLPLPSGPGLAVDMGTTTVMAASFGPTGQPRTVVSTWNLQRFFGADVMARVSSAHHPAFRRALREAIWASVDAVARACGAGFSWARAVGNPVVHHLAAGLDPSPLGVKPFRPRGWGFRWREFPLPGHDSTTLQLVPPLGGLVGSDMAATLALLRPHIIEPWMVLDIGTNAEIAVCRDGQVWFTSVPAGPAFEATPLGWSAPGVALVEHLEEGPEGLRPVVRGEGTPAGLAGSAMVDACAFLLKHGLLDETGRLRGLDRVHVAHGLWLDQRQVREIQKAKAAVEGGVRAVMRAAGISSDCLTTLVLSGTFGMRIDVARAQDIGLLPLLAPGKVAKGGNTALVGAGYCHPPTWRLLRQVCHHVSLSGPIFTESFVEALRFRPWG